MVELGTRAQTDMLFIVLKTVTGTSIVRRTWTITIPTFGHLDNPHVHMISVIGFIGIWIRLSRKTQPSKFQFHTPATSGCYRDFRNHDNNAVKTDGRPRIPADTFLFHTKK